MDKKTEDYLERLGKHKELCNSRAEYAMKRLDIVIIALASSGLLLIFNHLKDHPSDGLALLAPIGLFVVAIIVNIISQWFGYYANQYESDWTEAEIEKEKKQSETKKKQRALILNDCARQGELAPTYTKWTNRANKVASVSLGLGITVLLTLFIFSVFC